MPNPIVPNDDYTAVVNSGTITPGATSVSFSVASANDCYIYRDMGSGNIGDFELQFTHHVSASSGISTAMVCAVADTLGNMGAMDTANEGIAIRSVSAFGTGVFYQIQNYAGATAGTTETVAAQSTNWYVTVSRVSSTLTVTVRSGSHGGTELDSASLTVPTTGYRYLYIGGSQGSGAGSTAWSFADGTEDISDPLTPDYTLNADTATFNLTGIDVALTVAEPDYTLTASPRTYILTGIAADLTYTEFVPPTLTADTGQFILTRNDAKIGTPVNAEPGAFAITAQSLTFLVTHKLNAENEPATDLFDLGGNFLLGTPNAALEVNPAVLPVTAGEFALTGNAAILGRGKQSDFVTRQFTLTGNPITLTAGGSMTIPIYYTTGA
jgi:hypothetical protein